ncbi:Hypothetical protein NCS54_00979400 [Fusarium falciforme]|uniref:Hypothetical protein n=1 Tax=Fusarium falciforme TaxID=195108 RepID=UPI0023007C87|nr:Hypothetical protein NCS54_00979400 [Fusarium falciforme]WAO92292.1 Hypothetical protein NCS54_00979400 [Fusarium falciforme]
MLKDLPWPRKTAGQGVRAAEIAQDLAANNRGLFAPPYGPLEIQVEIQGAELSSRGTEPFSLESEGALREHLYIYHHHADVDSPSDGGYDIQNEEIKASIFLIKPTYGWGNLKITRDGMLSLLSALDVSPSIYRYLTAFGRKSSPIDEGFAGFDLEVTSEPSGGLASLEFCYLLKYVSRRENASSKANPWSIRHALIHQKIDLASNRVSNILVRLPEKVKEQLSTIVKDNGMAEFARDWTWLHAACFSSVDNDLRQFINYLDQEITKVFDRVIMSNMEPTKLNEFDSVQQTSKDLKTLQSLSDQARRLMNTIDLNIETIKCMLKEINGLRVLSLDSPHCAPVEMLFNLLEKTQQEHRFSLKNASAVLDRARATSEQLRDTASLRNSEISKMSSEMANLNTLAIARLAEQSSRETHIVKTLTVLALIFVPASFVADFLQMGFITITEESPMRWSAAADLKIYAILALPLIGVTMLIYGCVEMMQRTSAKG